MKARHADENPLALDPSLPTLLVDWYSRNARDLPWRRNRDPYRVWISEIMLQQTRVEVVKAYYTRFLTELPTVEALADADEERLLKLWEGLGYYSRARNLQKAARMIVSELGGRFPETYEGIMRLPGVGEYTAGAIASICFGVPVPAVDGNVLRVVARVLGISDSIDAPETKKRVASALREVYPKNRPGDFTQSLMELGATVCLPNGAPRCDACPVAGNCFARRTDTAASFPVKAEKKERRVEKITVLLLENAGAVAIRRREQKGVLHGMWEFPNAPGDLSAEEALALADGWGMQPIEVTKIARNVHVFTHIRWEMTCLVIACAARTDVFTWADEAALADVYSLPTAFRKLLS